MPGFFLEGGQNSQNVRLKGQVFSLFFAPLYLQNLLDNGGIWTVGLFVITSISMLEMGALGVENCILC